MLVYICCAGGATSSMFCKKIANASTMNVVVVDMETAFKNYESYNNEYELILVYGPAEFLRERYIKELSLDKKISSIWIAPQERFMLPVIKKMFNPYNIPVETINMRTFGTMNGKQALEDILALQ